MAMDTPCILGFDEVFEDGCIVGNVNNITPMSMEEVDELMRIVLENKEKALFQ